MPGIKSTWWFFTFNNPPEPHPSMKFDPELHVYLTYQYEKGKNGTPHYQGVVQMQKQSNLKGVIKSFGTDKIHWEPRRTEAAINYCQKEDGTKEGSVRLDGPWEFGEYVKQGSNKRKRKRLLEQYDEDPEMMKVEDPLGFMRAQSFRSREKFLASDQFGMDTLNQEWQKELLEELEQAADKRKIHWVYGPKGGEGKSTMALALAHSGWAYIVPGEKKSMSFMYKMQGVEKNVVIDMERRVSGDKYDAVYSFMENVKNRVVFNEKYMPTLDILPGFVHVVVMSNDMYDTSKLSGDRFCLHDLSLAEVFQKELWGALEVKAEMSKRKKCKTCK